MFMPFMTLQMSCLPEYVQICFMVKFTDGKFNLVWIDYVLGITENKALKSSGSIIDLTHQDNTLGQWFLAKQ